MNEILGMMTVFNMMLGGSQKVTGPVPCDKEVTAKVDALLLQDENGKLGENFAVEKTETTPESFIFDYKIRANDGSERHHIYHIATAKDCSSVEVKRL